MYIVSSEIVEKFIILPTTFFLSLLEVAGTSAFR